MRKEQPAVRFIVAILLATWIATGESSAQTTVTSTEQDQKELAVTVYNSNVALVRDVRRVRLPEGTIDMRYMDIAAGKSGNGTHRFPNCAQGPERP
jgi:hypothetical protein